MALSPPYRVRIATEDVSAFDAGEAPPRRSYLLAARLFVGGLSGSALILLLVISSFAVGFGAQGLLPATTAPTTIEIGASAEQKTAPTAVVRAGHKPIAGQGLTAVRAQGRQARPAPVAQGSTTEPPTTQTKANAVTGAPTQPAVALPEPSLASSAQEQGPQADEPAQLPAAADVVDTLVSAVPALPMPPALPAMPAPAAVVTTVTTLVRTP